MRGVIYDDHRGGYIDNVPATFTRKNTDLGIALRGLRRLIRRRVRRMAGRQRRLPGAAGKPRRSTTTTSSETPSTRSTYQGTRVEALYKINDDWNVLLSQSYQDMNSQGVFYQQPNASDGGALAPLEVTLFNPAYDKDRFESTAWT